MNRIQPRGDLTALSGYHSASVNVSVRLNANESPLPPPAAFVDDWLDALRTVPLNRYPDRSARILRESLGTSLGQPSGRIFCANGSNEVLQTLMLTYGGPGRRALILEPTYPLHSHIARITGTEIVSGARSADFTIDPDALESTIKSTDPDLVFLCSPNNPSGTVDSSAVLDAALRSARGLVIVDEAYGEFSPSSAIGRVNEDSALVVVKTYSKVWSMAALRLGYCIAPTWVVEELEKVVLPYHLAAATQSAGIAALKYRTEMDARVRELVSERERLMEGLRGFETLEPLPSGANFILFRVGKHGDTESSARLWSDLVAHGVLIRDFSAWPGVEGCLRVTVGSRGDNDAFLTALGSILRESGDS
ncbi:unannotated protein [freshwater metagenome]|uniref:Unannotated protein n=1 Tax=freshwater metagenome TaxID=449393 RepID=A0A6J6XFG8_9ZZZZ|nr:histidinol-phosphate transaminase [Actinomycetota bacterium]